MQNCDYEMIRNYYRPDVIEILFVGESRLKGGIFFFNEDSSLFRETKKAFDEYLGKNIFTLDSFKKWNCWLYDICEIPVNGLPDNERKNEIRRNIPYLEKFIESINPKYIIVCKKTLVRDAIYSSNIMKKYRENETVFFLPHPSNGRQSEYREGLINALTKTKTTFNDFSARY